jgi:hypothetical protein
VAAAAQKNKGGHGKPPVQSERVTSFTERVTSFI